MIELKIIGDIHYDCTYDYNVLIKNICTVNHFVNNVTKRKDSRHGTVIIIDYQSNVVLCKFDYKDCEIKHDINSKQNWDYVSNSVVLSSVANGGYGSMIYFVYINRQI